MKKQKGKNIKKKKDGSKKIINQLLSLIIFFSVLLFVLVVIQSGIFSKEKSSQIKDFEIRDECSFIAGSLIHQVKSEGDCAIRCRNDCILRELDYKEVNFTSAINNCNTCHCYCS